MKKLGTWLLCVGFTFICGCGMFGSTEFYASLAQMCMRCHGSSSPSKSDVLPGKTKAGMQGEVGLVDPHGCPFPKGR